MIQVPAKLTFGISLCCVLSFCSLASCDEIERKGSDSPITREEALQQAGIKLPLPTSAKNIQFQLSGETQNWNLYLSFEAPIEDTKETVRKELEFFSRREKEIYGSETPEFLQLPISTENVPLNVRKRAPTWWQPFSIKNGYFIGYLDAHNGPRFWINSDTSQVFFFEHF